MSLTKNEVQSLIAKHLDANPYTQLQSIRSCVKVELERRGEIGEKTSGNQYHRRTWVEDITNQDALLTNEVFYDFLYERIITPGIDRSNLELPWVHVSDKEKLKKYL